MAEIQNNLGIAYQERIGGKGAENLEAAIRCYLAALEVRTPEAFPEQWASTQHNLGAAYSDRIRGRGQKIWKWQSAVTQLRWRYALAKPSLIPCRNSRQPWSCLPKKNRQFRNAYIAFAAAIDTVDSLRGEIVLWLWNRTGQTKTS
jgi:hypothetical protein